MVATKRPIIAMLAPVTIQAAESEGDKPKGPPTFSVVAYTGGAMNIAGYDRPLVVDLGGLKFAKSIIANLDHVQSQRVGHVTGKSKDDGSLILSGVASASTPYRDEVINNAAAGFPWQASIEAYPDKIKDVAAGETVTINGQEFNGPLYHVRTSTLSGFAFVSHGADDNTTAKIAATAVSKSEVTMKAELKKWIEAMLPGVDVDTLPDETLTKLEADYNGHQHKIEKPKSKLSEVLEAKEKEVVRVQAITDRAAAACDARPYDIETIKKIAAEAIDGGWTEERFRLELFEASIPPAHTVMASSRRDKQLTNKVVEAAICLAGNLKNAEKQFDDQTLQCAHDRFKNGIGLRELFCLAAEANGYKPSGYNVDIEVQRAAFGLLGSRAINAAGFSTFSLPNTLAAGTNKFLREGWMSVDQTPLRIAAIRSVRDFKTISTVSLTGAMQFEKVGAAGELKHGTLGEETYTNKADTYGVMMAITRTDIINDDLGALTAVPRRIGRGAMLLLNHIFWTEFLNNSAFFATGNSNVNEGVADMTVGGLAATEVIFANQTDPDGKPLGVSPAILLVPTALKASAHALMTSERLITGASSTLGDGNIWRDRFRVESSPYMSNTSYTGYSAQAWYMLADPNEMPVIEIAALNGRVEPTVETADADFNVLGVQMRGYSDVGVNLQEYRGGVRADGNAS